MVVLERCYHGLGGMVGPRERSPGGIVRSNRLRTIHG
jgi:hypothetical protein